MIGLMSCSFKREENVSGNSWRMVSSRSSLGSIFSRSMSPGALPGRNPGSLMPAARCSRAFSSDARTRSGSNVTVQRTRESGSLSMGEGGLDIAVYRTKLFGRDRPLVDLVEQNHVHRSPGGLLCRMESILLFPIHEEWHCN